MNDSKIEAGERCWFYRDGLISFVDVTAVRDVCVGEPIEFRMYDVRTVVSGHDYPSVNRIRLFRCPAERQQLMDVLGYDARRAQEYRRELAAQEPDFVPDPDKDEV